MTEVARLVRSLELQRHPEGGWFRETWRGPDGPDGRPTATSILYLLGDGEVSAWHRIDADEVWHYHAGDPLVLSIAPDGEAPRRVALGAGVDGATSPQAVVPAGAWQSARSTGRWTLAGCTVAPGFVYEGFELAPPGWAPEPG